MEARAAIDEGLAEIAEGLVDYEIESDDRRTMEDVKYWTEQVADPCCYDCGCYEYYKEELQKALKAREEFVTNNGA